MDRRTLYDDDVFAWSEQQADVLRRLAASAAALPNELDLEHVAEEIEDVGKSERHAAESALRLILVHLIKLAVAPGAPAVRHWRSEIVTFHIELMAHLTPSMSKRIDLDQVWKQAKRQAQASLDEAETGEAGSSIWALARCPLDLATLAADELDVDHLRTRFPGDL